MDKDTLLVIIISVWGIALIIAFVYFSRKRRSRPRNLFFASLSRALKGREFYIIPVDQFDLGDFSGSSGWENMNFEITRIKNYAYRKIKTDFKDILQIPFSFFDIYANKHEQPGEYYYAENICLNNIETTLFYPRRLKSFIKYHEVYETVIIKNFFIIIPYQKKVENQQEIDDIYQLVFSAMEKHQLTTLSREKPSVEEVKMNLEMETASGFERPNYPDHFN